MVEKIDTLDELFFIQVRHQGRFEDNRGELLTLDLLNLLGGKNLIVTFSSHSKNFTKAALVKEL